jgi:hypothetical protein
MNEVKKEEVQTHEEIRSAELEAMALLMMQSETEGAQLVKW